VPEQAERPVAWEWNEDRLTVTVPQLGTHLALVIEGVEGVA
jgi:hypothetical protein